MTFEVLRKEVETLDRNEEKVISEEQHLLINPEFVESMDNSDGQEKFSFEDQAIDMLLLTIRAENERLKNYSN